MIFYLLLVLSYFEVSTPLVETAHNYHITRTQMVYNTEDEEWQISLYVFIDDLELALENKDQPKLRLGMKRESSDADIYIEAYLNKYLKFNKTDGAAINYQWLGKEMTEDLSSFWIYLYVENASPIDAISIENRLLTHLYDDQQNQVNIIDPAKENHQILFNKDYWKETVIFINK